MAKGNIVQKFLDREVKKVMELKATLVAGVADNCS